MKLEEFLLLKLNLNIKTFLSAHIINSPLYNLDKVKLNVRKV